MPVKATLWNDGGIEDIDVRVTFDNDGNPVMTESEEYGEPATPDNAPETPGEPSDGHRRHIQLNRKEGFLL